MDWNKYVILIATFENHYHIYIAVLELEFRMNLIEQIDYNGQFVKTEFLVERENSDITLCVMANNIDQYNGVLYLLRWRYTHFTTEYRKEVKRMNDVHILQDQDDHVIIVNVGIVDKNKFLISIYRLENNYRSIVRHQTFISLTQNIRPLSFNNEHYLMMCKSFDCVIYKWIDKHFIKINHIYLKENYNFLYATKMNLIAMQHLNKIMIFTNPEFKNPTIAYSNVRYPSNIIIHTSFSGNVTYVILIDTTTNFSIKALVYELNFQNQSSSGIVGNSASGLLDCFDLLKSEIFTFSNYISAIQKQNILKRKFNSSLVTVSQTDFALIERGFLNIYIECEIQSPIYKLLSDVIYKKTILKSYYDSRIRRNIKTVIKTMNLFYQSKVFTHQNMLQRSFNQNITGTFFILNDLSVHSFYSTNNYINFINIDTITNIILPFNSLKRIKNMRVSYILVNNFSKPVQNSRNLPKIQHINQNIMIENLHLKYINKYEWMELKKSLYVQFTNIQISGL